MANEYPWEGMPLCEHRIQFDCQQCQQEGLRMHDVYPCTVIPARYGGVYEGASWLAFNCVEDQVPWEATGDDITCGNFWNMQSKGMLNYAQRNVVPNEYLQPKLIVVGKGESPNLAVEDLIKRLE